MEYYGSLLILGIQERQKGPQDFILIHLRVDESNNFSSHFCSIKLHFQLVVQPLHKERPSC